MFWRIAGVHRIARSNPGLGFRKEFFMNLKYMILGAGGTGGILGATLTKAGKDVTFIARGSNLDAMRNNGLIIRHLWDQTEEHLEVRALSMEESCALSLAPEVIFICVKEYSLDSVLPFIRQTAGPRTIIIPILNIYGTGAGCRKNYRIVPFWMDASMFLHP